MVRRESRPAATQGWRARTTSLFAGFAAAHARRSNGPARNRGRDRRAAPARPSPCARPRQIPRSSACGRGRAGALAAASRPGHACRGSLPRSRAPSGRKLSRNSAPCSRRARRGSPPCPSHVQALPAWRAAARHRASTGSRIPHREAADSLNWERAVRPSRRHTSRRATRRASLRAAS